MAPHLPLPQEAGRRCAPIEGLASNRSGGRRCRMVCHCACVLTGSFQGEFGPETNSTNQLGHISGTFLDRTNNGPHVYSIFSGPFRSFLLSSVERQRPPRSRRSAVADMPPSLHQHPCSPSNVEMDLPQLLHAPPPSNGDICFYKGNIIFFCWK